MYVNANGEAVDIEALKHKYKPKPRSAPDALKRTTDRQSAKVSDGFIVTGFSPAHMEMAKVDHEAQIVAVNAHNERERHKSNPDFKRAPDGGNWHCQRAESAQ